MSDTYARIMRPAAPAAPGHAAVFDAAVSGFRAGLADAAGYGGEESFAVEDAPAPRRLAPYAVAAAATVQRDGAEVASGRLILLYDPDGQQGWPGVFRLVAYVRADVEPEVAADPLLGEVGWSWLTEALTSHAPDYQAESGTVTRVVTEGFGIKQDELPMTSFELRASWSPGDDPGDDDIAAHVAAWCACLAASAGLEPPGTLALPPGRR
jgi:Protein of unknown function (DUF3000)